MEKIKPTYVTLEQAKLLSNLGLDSKLFSKQYLICSGELPINPTLDYIAAPEQWQVVEWLRVNHGIWVEVKSPDSKDMGYYISIRKPYRFGNYYNGKEIFYGSPQEAYSAAFDYILKEILLNFTIIQ
jgi:hypothetical protein